VAGLKIFEVGYASAWMLLNKALFDLPPCEIKKFGRENLTYGSLTMRGMETFVKSVEKCVKGNVCDVYGFDLGCGDGELIYHLGKLLPGSVWEGVEISEHRVSMQTRDVCIWQGDMLADSYRQYNVLHADNLCLEDEVADALEEKIATEFKGFYFTYRYPQNVRFLRAAVYVDKVLTETTWTKHFIHVFRLD
jgi:hypothetical protein